MRPFYYGLEVVHVYDRGSFYSPAVLEAPDRLPSVVEAGFRNLVALSLGTDYDFAAFGAARLKRDVLEGRIAAPADPAPAPADEGEDDLPLADEESDMGDCEFELFN